MSLINQMLQDLEKRRASADPASPLGGVSPSGMVLPPEQKLNVSLVAVTLVLLLVVAFLLGAQGTSLTRILPVPVHEESNAVATLPAARPDPEVTAAKTPAAPARTRMPATTVEVRRPAEQTRSKTTASPGVTSVTTAGTQTRPGPVTPPVSRVEGIEVATHDEITRLSVKLDRRSEYDVRLQQTGGADRTQTLNIALHDTAPYPEIASIPLSKSLRSLSTSHAGHRLTLRAALTSPHTLLGSALEKRDDHYRLVVELAALSPPAGSGRTAHTAAAAASLSGRSAATETGADETIHQQAMATRSPVIEKQVRPLSNRQRAELTFQQAVKLVEDGKQAAAITALQGVLELHAGHERAREILASLLLNHGRAVEAGAILEAGLNLNPRAFALARLYARILLGQGDTARAIGVLEKAAPAVTADPEYFALLAAVYQRAEQYARAAGVYEHILQVRPGVANWWLGLALSQEALGRSEAALAAYRRAGQVGGLSGEVERYVSQRIAALEPVVTAKAPEKPEKKQSIFEDQF